MAKNALSEATAAVEATAASSALTDGFEGFDIELEDLGMEGVSRSLSDIPVLKLTQSTTPEVKNRDLREIQAGMFMNDSTKAPLGETVIARVLRTWKCRTKFAPRDMGAQVECSCPTYNDPEGDRGSEYGLCACCRFNNFDMPEHCQIQYHMVVSLNNDPTDLYRVILSKTSFKAGRKMERSLQTWTNKFRGYPAFCFQVRINAKEETNKRGDSWFVYDIEAVAPSALKDASGKEVINPKTRRVCLDTGLDKDTVQEYLDVFNDIQDLRKNLINDHRERVAAKINANAEDGLDGAQESSKSFSEELGLTSSPTLADEDIPF